MMTVEQLRAALQDVPDYTWVFLAEGPLNNVHWEPGANEPFVLLQYVKVSGT